MPACLCRSAWLWLGACVVTAAGCSPPEGVRTYTAPRETPSSAPLPATPVTPPAVAVADGPDKSKTLGVIIPIGPGNARFIKFSGAIDFVTAMEPKFNEFVGTVRLANPEATPTYSVPAGWVENPPRQFVSKSFTVGPKGTPQVTLTDSIGGTLLANVNRWRKEVGLPDVTEADLPQSVTEITLGDTKAYRVDFRGPATPGSGAPGMRGMPAPK